MLELNARMGRLNAMMRRNVEIKWSKLRTQARVQIREGIKNGAVKGRVTRAEAEELMTRWAGPNAKRIVSNDGKKIVVGSEDGTLVGRMTLTPKMSLDKRNGRPFSQTGYSANFEYRPEPNGPFTTNIHIDLVP